MVAFFLLMFSLCVGIGETIDRIIVVVGGQVITELQLEEELRVTALLNEQPLSRDESQRRAAANRLIDQTLIVREMDLTHYPLPGASDMRNAIEHLQKSFGGPQVFADTLLKYGVTESVLQEHLALQASTLNFVAFRFRPDLGVSDEEIKDYYQREVDLERKQHPKSTVPTLAIRKQPIRDLLLQERIDAALNDWLAQEKNHVQIRYFEPALAPVRDETIR